MKSRVRFRIGEVEHEVKGSDVDPETSLNEYLRNQLHLRGTKRMCEEGGCGTCIVAVEEYSPDGTRRVFAVNSCLVSILSCHGWKIHTVEGIGNPLTGYHQVQKVLADHNGTQCGFCSPGMVMNMYALQQSGPKTKKSIENSFGGNMCRCTGYRPILEAFYTLASDIEDVGVCPKFCPAPKAKLELKVGGDSKWVKVYYMNDLLDALRMSGGVAYMLVGGNTAQGVVKPEKRPKLYIDISNVDELTDHQVTDDTLILGANITLSKTIELFYDLSKNSPHFRHLKQAADHFDLIANVPVRNIGTLAGNLMLKHQNPRFQSDVFLVLETLGAKLTIMDTQDNELTKTPAEFLNVDMHKKVIKFVTLKGLNLQTFRFGSYKIMQRAQNTHAIVNAGFLFELSPKNVIQSASIVYGAINSTFIHASNTEGLLKGLNLFDDDTLRKALESLNQEILPDVEPPDPGPNARKQLALNLFYKFVLSISPESKISDRHRSGASLLARPLSSGVQDFTPDKTRFPVTEPLKKLEALAQTSGQAEYVMDRPDHPNQLHAALATVEATPGSRLISIDPSKALGVEGVVAFYSAKDIPGVNTAIVSWLGVQELFCSGLVQYYSQPAGVLVATSRRVAVKAALLVEYQLEESKQNPVLSIKDILAGNHTDRIKHKTSVVPKTTKKGKHQITGEFNVGSQYHYFMENHSCQVEPKEDGLEVWATTQFVSYTQFVLAEMLAMDAQKIDVMVRRVGGGYGGKVFNINYACAAAALAAVKLHRPTRIELPLDVTMRSTGKRLPFYGKYQVEVDDRGVIENMESQLYSDYGVCTWDLFLDTMIIDCFTNCYNTDTWKFDTYTCKTDTPPNTYARSPGTLEGMSCIEAIMEDIACQLNLNPMEVKMANMDRQKHPKLVTFLEEMKTLNDIDKRLANITTYNQLNRWKKKGLSIVPMKYVMSVMGTYTTTVSIFSQNGGVAISHAGVEIGQGINTKVAQVCAYKLGIPTSLISIKPHLSYINANSFATAGSWTSEVVCQAVITACDKLLQRMDPVKKLNPKASWAELVQKCYHANINLSASGFSHHDHKTIQDYLIYGMCAAEVEVDVLTGQYLVSRVDIIEDLGDSINPLVDVGQVEGAFVMGMGYYLTESLSYDSKGKLLTSRTWNYTPPGAKDIPVDFRVRFPSKNPNPLGVLNSKACSEPPMCLTVAVPLAIRHALASARMDADPTKNKWVHFDGPTSVDFTLMHSLTDYSQFSL